MFFVGGDVSFNSKLFVVGDVSFNSMFFVGGDVSFNSKLFVVGDVSFNSKMFVGDDVSFNSKFFVGGDVSFNSKFFVGGDVSFNSMFFVGGDVSFNSKMFVGGDVSFNSMFFVGGDVSFNSKLFVGGDVSFNSMFFVGGDVSFNSKLFVGGDVSFNSKLFVGGDVSFNSKLFVGNDVSFNSKLFVARDVSFNSKLFVGNDVSFNSKLFVRGDVSMNSKLFVARDVSFNSKLFVGNDVSFNSKLFVGRDVSFNSKLFVGNDVSFNSKLFVGNDVSFNSKLFVGDDVSFNSKLFVGNDLSLNGNLYVMKRSVFTLDVSMLGNLDIGSGSSSVAINKDISSNFALDVSGVSKFRGNVDVSGTFTVNGVPVEGSLTGNVQVGSNSGFVTINKPQFYSDPSLTIYYDFDTLSYTGTTIANKGNGGAGLTATLQGSNTNQMIDSSEKKWGTASLKQNTAVSNDGMTINSTIPVSNTFSVSLWVKKSGNTTIDRLFEFSNIASGTSENETIALNVNTSGKLVPIITNVATSAVTLSNNYIFDYNIGNNIWNNIVWILASGKSFIYINGTICQIDTVNTITNLTNRTYGYIARTNNTTGYAIENGNIDDFRYYKDKALSYPEIYQLSTNNFYTLDICGGFLSNGPSVIYEASGSVATANSGSLTLLHGNESGSSSIMFKSLNDPLDYAYIQYDENSSRSSIQPYLKYDLSSNVPSTLSDAATITNTGTYGTSSNLAFTAGHNQFAWISPTTYSLGSINGVTPAFCISFNQTNVLSAQTSNINFLNCGTGTGTSSFSLSLWIRPTGLTLVQAYVRYYIAQMIASPTSNIPVVEMWLEGNNNGIEGKIVALFNNNGAVSVKFSSQILSLDQWYHVALVVDSKTAPQLYVNGILGGGADNRPVIINNFDKLFLGAHYYNRDGDTLQNKGFRGQMAFVNYYNQELTASDITYLYNNPANSSITRDRGLMTIGIENSEKGYINNDCIALLAGQGFVGVNTKTPQYSLDVSGQIRIYEEGTIASATNGSLTLEHAAGGTSSLVFKASNSNSTKEYAYVQYEDNNTITYIYSIYKWNLSPGANNTYNPSATVDTSVGSNTSQVLFVGSASSAFFSVAAPSPPSTFPSNAYCILFNQTNETGTAPITNSINYLQSSSITSSANITISFWIRPAISWDTYNIGGNYYAYTIAHFTNIASSVIDIYIRGYDQKLFVLINGSGANFKYTNSSINNDVWTHVAFTYSTNDGYIYINGIRDEITVGTGYTASGSLTYNNLLLGMKYGENNGTNYRKGFRGYMNFINIFDQALSYSNITYLYNNPSYGQTTEGGLMTIGIENDSPYNDRITLWPNSGTGYVGINTKTPQATLDINGTLNVNGNITNNSGAVGITGESGTLLTLKNTSNIGARSEVNIDFLTQTSTFNMARISVFDTTVNTNGTIQGFASIMKFYLAGYTQFIEYMSLTSLGLIVTGITVGKGGPGNQDGRLAIGENALVSGTHSTSGWSNTAIGSNTLTAVAIANNTAVGAYALQNHTSSDCTAVGAAALQTNTTGYSNTAVGSLALYTNNGNNNTAVGVESLNLNTSGSDNTAVGTAALRENTTGYSNTGVGLNTLRYNTIGFQNTAVGLESLHINTSGSNNTAVGLKTLRDNTTGYSNTGVGLNTLRYNTIGFQNTAVGLNALYNNTSGSQNIAVGIDALFYLNGQEKNTAVGHNAGKGVGGVGNYNTFIGANTYQVGNGINNTYLGYGAYSNGTYDNSTAIGVSAEITASNQIKLGTNSTSVYCGNNLLLQGNGSECYIRNTTASALYFGTEAYNYMNISSSGLTVNKASGTLLTLQNTAGLATGSESNIDFRTGQSGFLMARISALDLTANINAGFTGKLRFFLSAGGNNAITEHMSLTDSGLNLIGNIYSSGSLIISNNIGGGTASQKNIDFYTNTGTFQIGRIAVNNRGTGIWSSSMSFFVAIHTDQLYEAIRITGVAQNSANCCDVKIYGDVEAVSYNAVSDYREKKNVVPLDDSFTIDGLNPVTYNLKSSGRQDIGFIAHEVQEFYPFLVSGEKDGKDTQSLNYNGFIGILTKEIKVLKKKEAKALAKAAEQEARIVEQEARIQALEKMMLDLINK